MNCFLQLLPLPIVTETGASGNLQPVETYSSEENNVMIDNAEMHEEVDLVGGISEDIIDFYDEPASDHHSDFEQMEYDTSDGNSIDGSEQEYDSSDGEYNDETDEEIILDDFDYDHSSEHIIHPSLSTTKIEALQMILIYFMRHNLTFAALEDLLLLVNSMLKINSLPTTKYNFFKSFSMPISPKYHFYCKNKLCGNLIMSSSDRNVKHSTTCDICETQIIINSKSEQRFVTLPLQCQLKEIIQQNTEIWMENGLGNTTSSLQDIKDGEIYKTFANNGTNPKISLVMNTDGVQVFKSNNKSLWPVQVIINELPVEKRFLIKNILVLGLFYDKNHPQMQHLLKPFMMELRDLNRTGKFSPIKFF